MPRKHGSVSIAPMTAKDARFRIWRSMRISKRFTLAELAASADASYANVLQFIRALRKAGYVKLVRKAIPAHRTEGRAVFLLADDSGPIPPRFRRDGSVFDANREKHLKDERK